MLATVDREDLQQIKATSRSWPRHGGEARLLTSRELETLNRPEALRRQRAAS